MATVSCTTLPGFGPAGAEIAPDAEVSAEDLAARNFTVIPLTPEVTRAIGAPLYSNIASTLGGGGAGNRATRVGVGDRMAVRIWESSPDGLFSSPSSKNENIPVVVDSSGQIYIPYVGAISVLGLSVEDVRARIQEGLQGKAVDPQVVVSLEKGGAQGVTVVGDARKPGRYDIPESGMRLLDVVALAGGAGEASFDTEVSVVRDGRVGSARLDDLSRVTGNNIWLQPRDTIELTYRPRSFTAFGSVNSNRQQPFKDRTVNLAEALAQAGGLNPRLADEGGVFIFRFESEQRVKKAGGRIPSKVYARGVPTIYRLDFSTPDAFFLAQSFAIRDKDVLYVAEAPASEFRKFADFILTPFLAVGDTGARVASSVAALQP